MSSETHQSSVSQCVVSQGSHQCLNLCTRYTHSLTRELIETHPLFLWESHWITHSTNLLKNTDLFKNEVMNESLNHLFTDSFKNSLLIHSEMKHHYFVLTLRHSVVCFALSLFGIISIYRGKKVAYSFLKCKMWKYIDLPG